jgi:tRNA dimethylallyltransferase
MTQSHFPLRLVVVCGPTASGKSGLAIALAQSLGGIIISADSRLVYRAFDIGTAKPTLAQQALVPHFCLDICDPTETLTVGDYQDRVRQILAQRVQQIQQPGQQPDRAPWVFLVGGTGLYIKAIVRGLKIPRVPPQSDLRSQLAALGQPWCYRLLQHLDPVATARIHGNDQVRTIRALEVFYATGLPISQQQGEDPPPEPILQLGLDCGDRLADRIALRTNQMMAEGFVAEVHGLIDRYGPDLPLLKTLGYQEVGEFLRGELPDLAATEAAIALHTRQFAKRQRTWFRAIEPLVWLDSEAPDLALQAQTYILNFPWAS